MLYVLIAICAGVLITISRLINSNLADKIGIFQGTFYNYIVGFTLSFIVLMLSNNSIFVSKATFFNIPIWAFTGGLVGVVVVALSSFVTPKISSFYLTIITFVGQLFTGIIMDYVTINVVSKGKLIGGFLVLAGLIYNVYIDRNATLNNSSEPSIESI